jgi:predicted metalloprotease
MVRWRGHRRSGNVEDRRSMGAPVKIAGGGIGMLVLAVAVWALGGDPTALLTGGGGAPAGPQPEAGPPPADDEEAGFIDVILADTEDAWHQEFRQMGLEYQEPDLVLFRDAVQSACGIAGSAVGPFYCPLDGKVYLDLSFFHELASRFGAPGDFARAYVVAHEVGHHVQNLTGISDEVRSRQERTDQAGANALSVRLELQADCLAGVWGAHAEEEDMLEPGDVEEGLRAAAAIGDDMIQRRQGGQIAPESFTHGTSEQRVRWFRQGLATGDPQQCDTFIADRL